MNIKNNKICKRFVVFIFLLIIGQISRSQNIYINNINSELNKLTEDTAHITRLIDFADTIAFSNPQLSSTVLKKTLYYSQKINFKKGIIWSYTTLGFIEQGKYNYKSSINILKHALKLASEYNIPRSQLIASSVIASNYSLLEEYDSSIFYYNEAINLANMQSDSIGMVRNIVDLLFIYIDQKQYKYVDSVAKSIIPFLLRKKDTPTLALNYSALADNAVAQKNYDKAVDYYKQQIKLMEGIQFFDHTVFINISYAFMKMDSLENVKYYLNQAKKDILINQSFCAFYEYFFCESEYYSKKGDYTKALQSIDSANFYSSKCENIPRSFFLSLYENYANAYEQIGNHKLALKYHKLYKEQYDLNEKELNNEKIVKTQAKLQLKEREGRILFLDQQNKLQDAEIQKNKNLIAFIIAASLLIIIIAALVYFRNKNKKETEKIKSEKEILELEQKLLLSQMNPHFIFNSLNSINTFLLLNDSKTTSKYLTDFAKLMRLILESSSKELISIENEIKILEYYLKLEQLRLNHKFEFTFDISDEIIEDNTELLIPPLLLQPFVENAILHGVSALDKNGLISINMFVLEKDFIQIEIEDNGVGRAAISQNTDSPHHHSMATQISEERIAGMEKKYSKKCSINIVDLYNELKQPTGTKVIIVLPIVVYEYKE